MKRNSWVLAGLIAVLSFVRLPSANAQVYIGQDYTVTGDQYYSILVGYSNEYDADHQVNGTSPTVTIDGAFFHGLLGVSAYNSSVVNANSLQIDGTLNFLAEDSSTINFNSQNITGAAAFKNGTVNLNGGSTLNGLYVTDSGTANLNNTIVATKNQTNPGAVATALELHSSSHAVVSNSPLYADVNLYDNSSLIVSSGSIEGSLNVIGTSTAQITDVFITAVFGPITMPVSLFKGTRG
jgi:hypothetical protein